MIRSAILGLIFTVVSALGMAFEPDELRERAVAMKREVAELEQQGRTEEAEKIKGELVNLLELAERQEAKDDNDLDTAIDERKANLERLRKEERRGKKSGAKHERAVRERIEATEQQINYLEAERQRRLAERRNRRRSDELDESGRRIEQVRMAAQNLKAAGILDLAQDLMEKAEAMEREQAKKRTAEEEIDALRREFEELQSQNKEIQRKFDQLEHEFKEFRERPVFRLSQ